MIMRFLLFAILLASFLTIVNFGGGVSPIDARCPNGSIKVLEVTVKM